MQIQCCNCFSRNVPEEILDHEVRFKSTLLKKVPAPADKRFTKMPSPLNVDSYDDDDEDVIDNGVDEDDQVRVDSHRFVDGLRQHLRHNVDKSVKKASKVGDYSGLDEIFDEIFDGIVDGDDDDDGGDNVSFKDDDDNNVSFKNDDDDDDDSESSDNSDPFIEVLP